MSFGDPKATSMTGIISWLIVAAFVVSLTWAILMAGVGWNNSLSDNNGFRQTQTAITSYYLRDGGPFLSYETPVLGRPWSLPFEFPLYQWTVALASAVFKTPLNQTGRFISVLFFYLSLAMVWWWLSELNITPMHRLVFLSLILVSPEYVFWSRTFMIESTALFFAASYLVFACRYARNRSFLALFLGGICAVLGALVKPSTVAGFMIVAALIYAWISHNQGANLKKAFPQHFVSFLVFICLPVLVAWAWTRYADEIKSLNVIGAYTTSRVLKEWNFGSLAQRFSANTRKIFFFRIIPDLLGSSGILLVPLFGICFARHRWFPFLACMVGFLSVFLTFTNLHVLHDYYTYANGFFLIAASSWCVVGLLEQKKWQYLGLVIFFVMMLASIKGYYNRYYMVQKNNVSHLDNTVHAIRHMARPHEIIVVFGQDWSSELPYYSERRALMWPAWMPQDMDSPEMNEALSRLGNIRVGALAVCNRAQTDSRLIDRATDVLKLVATPKYEDDVCSVYTPLPNR